jgi:DNA-binding NarL/FixJ family response regulator
VTSNGQIYADGEQPSASVVRTCVAGSATHNAALVAALQTDGIWVEADVATLDGVAETIDGTSVDVVVWRPDVGIHRAGVELRRLREAFGDSAVIVVSEDAPPSTMRRLLKAGADGMVFESEASHMLAPAVRAVAAGHLCYPRSMRVQLEKPALSYREKQILGLVVMGFTNAEIASKLFLAESTVKSHLSSAFGKLGVRSRNEASALILDPDESLGTGILELSGDEQRLVASHRGVPA